MKIDEMISEFKSRKNEFLDIYFLHDGRKKSGYLKNIQFLDGVTLRISIDEVKSGEEVLKKYSCKNRGTKSDEKPRLHIDIEKNKHLAIQKDQKNGKDFYRIDFENEYLGIIFS